MNTNLTPKEMLEFLKDICDDALRITLTTSTSFTIVDAYSPQCRDGITPDIVEEAFNGLSRVSASSVNRAVVFWGIAVDWKSAEFHLEGNVFVPQTESTKEAVLNWREG